MVDGLESSWFNKDAADKCLLHNTVKHPLRRTPVSQFECGVSVAATPMAVVASLVGYHRIVLLSKVKKVRRCCGEKRIVTLIG